MHDADRRVARRRLLQLAAASPLAVTGLWATPLGELLARAAQAPAGSQQVARDEAAIIAKVEDALDVFDFEAVARRTLPPAHLDTSRPARMTMRPFARTAMRSVVISCACGDLSTSPRRTCP